MSINVRKVFAVTFGALIGLFVSSLTNNAQEKPPCGLEASALWCERQPPQENPNNNTIQGWPTQRQFVCPEQYPELKDRCNELWVQNGSSLFSPAVCGITPQQAAHYGFNADAQLHDAIACDAASKGQQEKMYTHAEMAYNAILNQQGQELASQYMYWRAGFGFFDWLIEVK